MTDEKLIEEAAKAIHDTELHPGAWDDYGTWTVNTEERHDQYRSLARAAFAVFEEAHAPTDDEPRVVLDEGQNRITITSRHGGGHVYNFDVGDIDALREFFRTEPQREPTDAPEQTEFYEVMGGQGLIRIAKNLTKAEAEEVRAKFDRDCMRAELLNPPTRINKQHGRY